MAKKPRSYDSIESIPKGQWPGKHFDPSEFACRGTRTIRFDKRFILILDAIREEIGQPMVVLSGYRSEKHNKKVGGVPKSMHIYGQAADILIRGTDIDPLKFIKVARKHGITGIGQYPKEGFIHIDIGAEREWGTPYPKPIRKSRTAAGGLIAALPLVAQQIPAIEEKLLSYAQFAHLAPYVALAGIAIVLYARWDDSRKGLK